MNKEKLENLKVILSVIAIIIICGIMAIWVYNRFFHSRVQDPVGVPDENYQDTKNQDDELTDDEKNQLYFEDDPNVNEYPDEHFVTEQSKMANGYVHTVIDNLDISFGIESTEYSGSEQYQNQTESGEIRLILNPKIVDTTGEETRFIMYLTSTGGTLDVMGDKQPEESIPSGECLFATDKSMNFFRTAYIDEANEAYLSWLSSNLEAENDVIKFRLVGYNTEKFYGTYEINITRNANEKLEISSIDKSVNIDSDTANSLRESLNEVISNRKYGVSSLEVEDKVYYDLVDTMYFNNMTGPNGYEIIKKSGLTIVENGYYAVTINFKGETGMYMTSYFNKGLNFIGYDLYNFSEYKPDVDE